MSGLVAYGSSDEDEEDTGKVIGSDQKPISVGQPRAQVPNTDNGLAQSQTAAHAKVIEATPAIPPPSNGPLPGPSLGPSFPSASEDETAAISGSVTSHTAYREVIQTITLPTVPNFDIPPSPPGSPPSGVDAKIKQFMRLKKQGVHFNEKLASSSALKNPSLLGKLISNAGLDEKQQYANTLPSDVWDPDAFEEWMYKEQLEQARKTVDQQRQRERFEGAKTSVDFVPARNG